MLPKSEAVLSRPSADDPAVGYQRWRELLFVHWRVPVERLAGLLPRGLEVDTWDGDGWLGLVLFRMSGIRPRWFPALPGLSAFPETNLRTYVRAPDGGSGVWFFSLEASNPLAVAVARWRWRLNYHWARMEVVSHGAKRRYDSRRRRGTAHAHVEALVGESLAPTAPHSLEHFLIERYLLYTTGPAGGLLRGRVRHAPYPLAGARLVALDESLSTAAGIRLSDPPVHVVYSAGVDVEILGLARC